MLNELQNEWNEWVSLLNTLLMLKNPFGDKAISPYHDLGSYPVYCISLKWSWSVLFANFSQCYTHAASHFKELLTTIGEIGRCL